MRYEQLITRIELSKAAVYFVRKRLLANGISPTQVNIANEIGVEQPMISLVESSKKSFSKDKLEQYSQKIGKTFREFVIELTKYVPGELDARRSDTEKESDYDVLNETTDAIKILQTLLYQPKTSGVCKAAKFYDKAVRWAYLTFHNANFPIISSAIIFRHKGHEIRRGNRHDQIMVANEESSTGLIHGIPLDISDMLDQHSPCNADSLVEEFSVIRPAANFTSNFDQDASRWEKLVGSSAENTGTHLRVFVSGVQRSLANDEDTHSVLLLFVFKANVEIDDRAKLAMWLFGQSVQQIYSVELRDNARNIARLVNLKLQPADIRPHNVFYKNIGSACEEKLEAVVRDFFKRVRKDRVVGRNLATADIWSYDWTKGEFICLSKLFRMVRRKPGREKMILIDGKMVTLREAYKRAFKSLTPRSKEGKSAFILATRRAIIVDNPSVDGSTSSVKHPELDIGTFIGIPITLYDRQNDRSIYSVMYVRYVVRYVKNPRMPMEIVMRLSDIAAEFSPDIKIDLAPSMTGRGRCKSSTHSDMLHEEPTDVRIISRQQYINIEQ